MGLPRASMTVGGPNFQWCIHEGAPGDWVCALGQGPGLAGASSPAISISTVVPARQPASPPGPHSKSPASTAAITPLKHSHCQVAQAGRQQPDVQRLADRLAQAALVGQLLHIKWASSSNQLLKNCRLQYRVIKMA